MSFRTPIGFEYHWPAVSYSEAEKLQNWYINFETMTLCIAGTKTTYELIIKDDLIEVAGMNYSSRFSKEIIDAMSIYLLEKELLE